MAAATHPERLQLPGRPPSETALVWRPAGLNGVEALSARYLRQEFLPHRHEGFLVGVIEAGGHAVWCRGTRTIAGPGTIATMDPDEVHHGGAADQGGWRQRIMYVSPSTVADVLEDALDGLAPSPHFRCCFGRDAPLAAAFVALHQTLECRDREPLGRQTLFEWILRRVFRRFATMGLPPLALPSSPGLNRARDFLHAHLADPCPLGELARVAGLRRRQLVWAFGRRFGLPPHRYLMQLRIDAARTLLAQGVPAAEVATAVGFADQSHFLRRFKAVVGVTPGRYLAAS